MRNWFRGLKKAKPKMLRKRKRKRIKKIANFKEIEKFFILKWLVRQKI